MKIMIVSKDFLAIFILLKNTKNKCKMIYNSYHLYIAFKFPNYQQMLKRPINYAILCIIFQLNINFIISQYLLYLFVGLEKQNFSSIVIENHVLYKLLCFNTLSLFFASPNAMNSSFSSNEKWKDMSDCTTFSILIFVLLIK